MGTFPTAYPTRFPTSTPTSAPTASCPVTCELIANKGRRVNWGSHVGHVHKGKSNSFLIKVTHDVLRINSAITYIQHRCYRDSSDCLCECLDHRPNFQAGMLHGKAPRPNHKKYMPNQGISGIGDYNPNAGVKHNLKQFWTDKTAVILTLATSRRTSSPASATARSPSLTTAATVSATPTPSTAVPTPRTRPSLTARRPATNARAAPASSSRPTATATRSAASAPASSTRTLRSGTATRTALSASSKRGTPVFMCFLLLT